MDRLVVAAVIAAIFLAFVAGLCAGYLLLDWIRTTNHRRRNHT